jgi:hypothetical protein
MAHQVVGASAAQTSQGESGRGSRRFRRAGLTATVLAALGLLAGGAAAVPPASLPSATWVASGSIDPDAVATVDAVAVSDHTAFVGGDFNYVGPESGGLVAFDPSTSLPESGWPVVTGAVNASVADGDGGFFIGGLFSSVGGIPRSNLAHVLSNGTVDPGWSPSTDAAVNALARSGSTVYAGGSFATANGAERRGSAAFDVTSGALLAWGPALGSSSPVVLALAVSGSTVYVGGSFAFVDGDVTRSFLVSVDATTGVTSSWEPDVDGLVRGLAVSGTTVYAVGDFTTVQGSVQRRHAAAFDLAGGAVTGWDPAPNGSYVAAVTVDGGKVYLGGRFTTLGGNTRLSVGCVDAQTGVATSWAPEPFIIVLAIAVESGKVAVGGRNGVEVFDAATSALSLRSAVGGAVKTVQFADSHVLAGGTFASVDVDQGGRTNVASLALGTGRLDDSSLPLANLNGRVTALAVSGSTLYVGGYFRVIAGATGAQRNRLAAFNVVSGSLRPWNPNVNGPVESLVVAGSSVYVGGQFTTANGGATVRNGLAAFDATTGAVKAWDPDVNGTVEALATDGSTVYAGGSFTSVNGSTARHRLAAFDAVTGAATDWDPNVDDTVFALDASGSTVYAGGAFTHVNGQKPRNRLAAFDTDIGAATAWNPDANSTVNAVKAAEATVLVGGSFTTLAGGAVARNHLAEVDAATGAADGWDPSPDRPVNAIAAAPAGPVVGGEFTALGNGARAQSGMALFTPLDRSISATGLTHLTAAEDHLWSSAVAAFSVPASTVGAGEFSATIDWGDGTSEEGTVVAVVGDYGSFLVRGTHTYRTSGRLPITVTVTDRTDSSNHAAADATVDVSAAPGRVGTEDVPTTTARPSAPPKPPVTAHRPPVPR